MKKLVILAGMLLAALLVALLLAGELKSLHGTAAGDAEGSEAVEQAREAVDQVNDRLEQLGVTP